MTYTKQNKNVEYIIMQFYNGLNHPTVKFVYLSIQFGRSVDSTGVCNDRKRANKYSVPSVCFLWVMTMDFY